MSSARDIPAEDENEAPPKHPPGRLARGRIGNGFGFAGHAPPRRASRIHREVPERNDDTLRAAASAPASLAVGRRPGPLDLFLEQ